MFSEQDSSQNDTNLSANGREGIIHVRDLYKSFGNNHVLQGVSLDVYEGENVVVLGRSGSGKSVLIKCMVRLLPHDSGTLKVFGQEVASLDAAELNQLRQRIGFSFQGSALYDAMTVRENLEFPLRRNIQGLSEKQITEKVEKALIDVGLIDSIDLMPSELSGGMKKRVGVARTLILEPELMLYDEPTAGLDPITALEINELILEVQRIYKTSSIVITHDLSCARITGNRIVVLIDGQFPIRGTYEELASLQDPRLKPFFDYFSTSVI